MTKSIEEVVEDIKVCLDQNRKSDQLLLTEDEDTLTLDEIIRSKVVEAVRRVHSAAPVYMLEQGHNLNDAVYWEGEGKGFVLLPEDFHRLVVFEMSDWERAVYTAISTEDPEYAKQRSRFAGIRGNAQKPVCAIGIRPEGMVLEFYSSRSEEAYVKRGVYLPEPKVVDGFIDFSARCYTAILYTAAGLVVSAFGDQEKSAMFNELAKTALQ